jgi:DNA-binding NarL/FixJ family response regulator
VKDANELIQIGASHFISKPVNPDEIYYLIAAVIEGKWDKLSVD